VAIARSGIAAADARLHARLVQIRDGFRRVIGIDQQQIGISL
jgi:hypothetical protein